VDRRVRAVNRTPRAARRTNARLDTVAIYYAEIGRIRLLSAEEEHAVFVRLDRLRRWRDSVKGSLESQGVRFGDDLQPQTPDENPRVRERIRRYVALVKAVEVVRAHIAQTNLRLAVALAKKYQGRGLTLSDLIQEANIGLLRAVDKFDVRRGVRFAAYAAWWIQQAIGTAVVGQARIVRVPAYLQERQRRLRIARDASVDAATLGDLAQAVGITPEQAQRALDAEMDTLSLDAPLSSQSRVTVGEFLAEREERRPDVITERAELQEHVERLFASVDPRTERILKMRYGFEDGVARSLQEVGDAMNLSRERVRQIEMTALQRFRARGNVERLRALSDTA
jgi:RNA polymerase primary sigma factor